MVMVEGRGKGRGRGVEPKIASIIWSVSLSADGKSLVKGTDRFLSCVARRCEMN